MNDECPMTNDEGMPKPKARMHARSFGFLALGLLSSFVIRHSSFADDAPPGALAEVAFNQLSSRNLLRLGQAALAIRTSEWKHAESANFIYHFFHGYVAAPVSVEVEFYYGVIARELDKDTTQWERKSHIFIFETPEDWAQFVRNGALDPWTGGAHAGGELFIRRDPQFKFKGNTLGHEVAHLVVDRFFGSNVPLWLNQGFAEYVSRRCYGSVQRARSN